MISFFFLYSWRVVYLSHVPYCPSPFTCWKELWMLSHCRYYKQSSCEQFWGHAHGVGWLFLHTYLRRRMAYGWLIFVFLRILSSVFQCVCKISHSHQKVMRGPLSLRSLIHLVSVVLISPLLGEIKTLSCFNIQITNYWEWWGLPFFEISYGFLAIFMLFIDYFLFRSWFFLNCVICFHESLGFLFCFGVLYFRY